MKRLYIDIGSTYFKIRDDRGIRQYFRNFDKNIFADLQEKCGDIIDRYDKEDIYICSSANGGLSTLIVGLSNSFSLYLSQNREVACIHNKNARWIGAQALRGRYAHTV